MPSESGRIRIRRTAGPAHAGKRLDQVAAELFADFSRARLQKWIRSGELTVDGRPDRSTYRISGGETLLLDAVPERTGEVLAQDIPLDILHADADLLVVNKPAGLVVHPAAGNPDGTLQNGLLFFDPALAELPRSGIVHRLDKDTSGVMVVARSLRAHTQLVKQLQSRSMSRIYRAIAAGDIRSGGAVEAPIGRHPRDRKRMAVVSSGRPATTHYRVLRRFGGHTHLELSLETGRTHQIRVHMAHIGHPLLGDPVYGKPPKKMKGACAGLERRIRDFRRQALHAFKLKLIHPGSGDAVEFTADLAADLADLLRSLSGEVR
jgi:23S rRNA pseudouridine1911/1915/1917 synthase